MFNYETFLNVGTPNGVPNFDHLLWIIFQSLIFTQTTTNSYRFLIDLCGQFTCTASTLLLWLVGNILTKYQSVELILSQIWIIINYSLPCWDLNPRSPLTDYMNQMTYQCATMLLLSYKTLFFITLWWKRFFCLDNTDFLSSL